MDQGTAERFISLMMADVLDHSNIAEIPPIIEDVREDHWQDLGDQDALRYDLVKSRQVSDDLAVNLYKMGVDCLQIEIFNIKYVQEMMSSMPKIVKNKSTEAAKKISVL